MTCEVRPTTFVTDRRFRRQRGRCSARPRLPREYPDDRTGLGGLSATRSALRRAAQRAKTPRGGGRCLHGFGRRHADPGDRGGGGCRRGDRLPALSESHRAGRRGVRAPGGSVRGDVGGRRTLRADHPRSGGLRLDAWHRKPLHRTRERHPVRPPAHGRTSYARPARAGGSILRPRPLPGLERRRRPEAASRWLTRRPGEPDRRRAWSCRRCRRSA